jgi:type II secretory pathway pseudopilin PulG
MNTFQKNSGLAGNTFSGFTLIELVIFVVITSIIASTIFIAEKTSLIGSPSATKQIAANMLAQQCMEKLLGSRRLKGYNTLSCPSSPSGTLCSTSGGYTVTANVTCTTLNGNSNFKTITVTVSGNATAKLQTLIANY